MSTSLGSTPRLVSNCALLLAAIAIAVVTLTGCDCSNGGDPPSKADEPTVITHDHTDVSGRAHIDLTDPDAHHRTELLVADTRRFEACHHIFEPDGEPVDWPVDDGETSSTVFGCNAEGYLELSGGLRALSYEIPSDDHDDVTDLRVTVYEPDGQINWTHRLKRNRYADNFAARYRGSFLTPLGDNLVCAGTRWMDSTQVLCARQQSGSVELNRHLELWLGLEPFGIGTKSFVAADTRGITRRYGFTGAEMRHRSFDEPVGRAGFYATDTETVYVVSDHADPVLFAWSLDDPERPRVVWRAELPERPHTGFAETSLDHRLLLFRIQDTMFGVDTDDGSLRMTFEIPDTNPSIAFSDDTLYAVVRPRDGNTTVFALDPDDGSVHWSADAPPGTLAVDYGDEHLLTRTVRTVRVVEP